MNKTHNANDAPASGSEMHALSPEKTGVEVLHSGRTVSDVIDQRISEVASVNTEEPFLVLNLDNMVYKHLRWLAKLPRVKPFYAVKCNNTPAVIKILSTLKTGFDCASKAEIELALSLGVAPDRIIYAHPSKPLYHIRYSRSRGVNLMTFDNEEELLKISLCHPQAKLVLRIAVDDSKSLLRLSFKFGARLTSVKSLLKSARELNLEVIGISFHIGSGCTGSVAFKKAIADARHAFDVGNEMGFQMSLLDIGGGFSGREDFQVKFEEFSDVINESLDEFFPPDSGVKIIAEPGRYYVESAFTLVMNVISKKVVMNEEDEDDEKKDDNSDRTIMYYVNDGVYGSLSCLLNDPAHTQVEPYLHRAVDSSEPRYRSIIWGPTCDGIDKVTEGESFPEMHVGDWLLIDNMGAYSTSLSTDFNGFERAQIHTVVTFDTWLCLNLSRIYDSIG